MSIHNKMQTLGQQAAAAAQVVANSTTAQRNQALLAIAQQLADHRQQLLKANQQDLEQAQQAQLDAALLDRLTLEDKQIQGMVTSLKQVAALADPLGQISQLSYQPSGIQVGKMRVPLGVVGIIYESRPNVTADAAGLCLKSGNACILRGGSEALQSNKAIAGCISRGLEQVGLPNNAVQLVDTTDRAAVGALISMPQWVNVIIPRGGKGLIERISAEAKVPVIKHLDGNCHVYIDQYADLDKAYNIAINAKTQRYGTCNTMETLLVHQEVAEHLLPRLAAAYQQKGVELRGCAASVALIADIQTATDGDWSTEYLAPVLAVKIVDSLKQAIAHINHYGSGHTDAIVSENYSHTQRFLRAVDSSSVMVNVSTRFADGFEYGLGAEIGISTDKFHARGPVGLLGLTCEKYIVLGDGQIRQ